MRINVSAWSIRQPIPAIVLFAVLMLLGVVSFMRLPVTRFPNIDIPIVSITVTQSGAAPAELETQVTKKVEDAVANITGVKHIVSTVTDGTSQTMMEFRLEVNTDRALNDVKDAIAKTRTVGDVDYAAALPVAGWITPVPGGVGPMTIACLLANTVTTASLIHGLAPPRDLTP